MKKFYSCLLVFLLNILFINNTFAQDDKAPDIIISTHDCMGTVIGSVTDKPNDPNTRVGLKSIELVSENNYKLEYNPFQEGATTTSWRLNVKDKSEDASVTVKFTDMNDNFLLRNFDYTSIQLKSDQDLYTSQSTSVGDKDTIYTLIKNHSEGTVSFELARLKFGTQYFRILEDQSELRPVDLEPQDEALIAIEFDAQELGYFTDSLIVGDDCIFYACCKLEANIGSASISVKPDPDFGAMQISSTVEETIYIENKGEGNLKIFDYSGPSDPSTIIVMDMPSFSPASPLIIKPFEKDSFKIRVSPLAPKNYIDTISFVNNVGKGDSLCIIKFSGISPKLHFTPLIEFNNQRIHRDPDFPVPAATIDPGIYMNNTGKTDVRIQGVNVAVNAGSEEAFIFDKDQFNDLLIETDKSFSMPVSFQPTSVGYHEIILNFDNDADLPISVKITGVGTVGLLNYEESIDFGTTKAGDNINFASKSDGIAIWNQIWFDPENQDIELSDSINISSLNSLVSGEIGSSPNWGTKGFRKGSEFLHSRLGKTSCPTTLFPGDTIYLSADFYAQQQSSYTAHLDIESDALDYKNQTQEWIGAAYDTELLISFDDISICTNEIANSVLEVENLTDKPLSITNTYLDPPNNVLDPIFNSIIMNINENASNQKDIQISYGSRLYYNGELVVENSSGDPTIRVPISIEINNWEIPVKSKITMGNNEISQIGIEDTITYTLSIDTNDLYFYHQEINGKVTYNIEYDASFLKAIPESISLKSNPENAYTISNIKDEVIDNVNRKNLLSFDVQLDYPFELAIPVKLLSLDFTSFMPISWAEDNVELADSLAQINCKIFTEDLDCDTLMISESEVSITDVCGYRFHQLKISMHEPKLDAIVKSNSLELNYTLYLPGEANISIYNSRGELIKEVINGNHKIDSYTKSVPIYEFPSSVYFISIENGPFKKVVPVSIIK